MSGYDTNPLRKLAEQVKPLNMWLLRLVHTSGIASELEYAADELERLASENARLGSIEAAAIKWRHAMCVSPDCGDGKLLHAYDCPALVAQRALVTAIDANANLGTIERVTRQCPTCTLPIDDDGYCSVTCPRTEPEPCCEHRCKDMAEHFARSGDTP